MILLLLVSLLAPGTASAQQPTSWHQAKTLTAYIHSECEESDRVTHVVRPSRLEARLDLHNLVSASCRELVSKERTLLYMHRTYGRLLSPKKLEKLLLWHEAHPPTAWERERNRRIFRVQGNDNPFVH